MVSRSLIFLEENLAFDKLPHKNSQKTSEKRKTTEKYKPQMSYEKKKKLVGWVI